MTKEEKQKKAEEKARRKAEVAEQKAQRKMQLVALKPYWFFLRYNVNARSCPQDFYLFWARSLLLALPWVFVALDRLLDFVRGLFFTTIIVAILCLIFPPVLVYVEFSLAMFIIGMIMLATGISLFIATVWPIFLAILKRRINDVSKTAGEAHIRFFLFVGAGALMLGSGVLSGIGPFAWVECVASMLSMTGLVLLIGQMNYYSFKVGIKGVNFAGPNPVETPLTESFLVEHGGRPCSVIWQKISFVLIGLVAALSFVVLHSFLRTISTGSFCSGIFNNVFFSFMIYGSQACVVAGIVFFVCFKSRLKTGDISATELSLINACFTSSCTEVTETLRDQVSQIDAKDEDHENEKKTASGGVGGILGKALFLFKVFFAVPSYYLAIILVCVALFNKSAVFMIVLLAIVLAIPFGLHYIKARVVAGAESVNWDAICSDAIAQLKDMGRKVALLPFLRRKEESNQKLSCVTQKRFAVRNVSLIDPFGVHNFALGQKEIGGIQLVFSILIVGLPLSWIWSIFDSIRYARMSDDEFLMMHSSYCVSQGKMDRIMSVLSRFSKIIAPVVACFVLFAFAEAFSGNKNTDGHSRSQVGCVAYGHNAQHKSSEDELDLALKDLKKGFDDIGRELKKVNEHDIEKTFEGFGRELEKEANKFENELNAACRELNSL